MAATPILAQKRETETQLDASFDPYVRLLKMLMPAMQGVIVHDGRGGLIWMSDDWQLAGVDSVVAEVIATAETEPASIVGLSRGIDADNSIYSFALRKDETTLQGVVTLAVPLTNSRNASKPLTYVQQLVQPVLECLNRELLLRDTLGSRERDLTVREKDASLLVQLSQRMPAADAHGDPLEQIYTTCTDHLNAALVALWVPEKHISVTRTRKGQVVTSEALNRAEKHLISWMQLQQRSLIVNKIARTPADQGTPYKILACPVRNQSERVIGTLAIFNPPSSPDFDLRQTRIVELLAKKTSLLLLGQYDGGTGLLLRPAFERQCKNLLAAKPVSGQHMMMYIDIDRLHVINETFGMHVGDEVIGRVAETMFKALPKQALAARISGDRLAVLLPNTDMDAAAAVAETVRAAVSGITPRNGEGNFDISASIGVAAVGNSPNPLPHALATAEVACKAAKDRGRNRVELFQDADQSIIRRHTDIMVIQDVRNALEHDRFRLEAQPILPLRGNFGRPRFELLIRMIDPQGDNIPPSKFISAAERYQLMPSVDRWVVHHACRELGKHAATLSENVARFAINLSGQSLRDTGFLEYVVNEVKSSGLPPGLLSFELTETAAVTNLDQAQEFIKRLQELGCQFALDDFGTGSSSLAYLKALSVSCIKIDGSFVRDAIINPRCESMIKAIAQLAKVMCIETTAEYVETDALRIRMADLGVDYGQGFAIGRPKPLSDLLKELAIYEASVCTWVGPDEINGFTPVLGPKPAESLDAI